VQRLNHNSNALTITLPGHNGSSAVEILVPGEASCLPRPWQPRVSAPRGPAAGVRCSTSVPGSSAVTRGSRLAVRPGPRHSAKPDPGQGCGG